MPDLVNQEVHPIAGVVKWYSRKRGYGFFVDDHSGADVLIVERLLSEFGRQTIVEGSWVEARCIKTERGLQACQIMDILPPGGIETVAFRGHDEAELVSNAFVPARVRWFSKDRGYGCAQAFCESEECFIHVSTLMRAGFEHVEVGEAISIRIAIGAKGLFAAEVAEWNANLEDCTDQINR